MSLIAFYWQNNDSIRLVVRIQINELINHRASKIQRNTSFYPLACKTIAFKGKTIAFDYIQFLVSELEVVIDSTNSTDRT